MENEKSKKIKFIAPIFIIPIVFISIDLFFGLDRIFMFYNDIFIHISWSILLMYIVVSFIFICISVYIELDDKVVSICKWVITIILVLCIGRYDNVLRDIPYVVKSDFSHIEGVPQHVCYSHRDGNETFEINGIDFSVSEPNMGISSGELSSNTENHSYRITYLPNSKYVISIYRN